MFLSSKPLSLDRRINYCLLHLLAFYWWVSPMLNTIFSIFSSFFRMFDFTVDILSSCYQKNMTMRYVSMAISCNYCFCWN